MNILYTLLPTIVLYIFLVILIRKRGLSIPMLILGIVISFALGLKNFAGLGVIASVVVSVLAYTASMTPAIYLVLYFLSWLFPKVKPLPFFKKLILIYMMALIVFCLFIPSKVIVPHPTSGRSIDEGIKYVFITSLGDSVQDRKSTEYPYVTISKQRATPLWYVVIAEFAVTTIFFAGLFFVTYKKKEE